MRRRLIACAVLTMLMFATIAAAGESGALLTANEAAGSPRPVGDGSSRDLDALQKKGRYKIAGDNCVWDINDSGPNQCTPQTRGRFKKGGDDSCVWDANDNGPDQCTPPKGRWKTAGNRCVWDPKDSGPNQCNPRQPRKSKRSGKPRLMLGTP